MLDAHSPDEYTPMHTYNAKSMADSWRTVRKNTVQVAEDIPADHYGFRATPDTMTVAQMLAHLATSTHWAEQLHFVERKRAVDGADFGRYMGAGATMAAALTTKDPIVDALITRGEGFALQLEAMTDAELAEPVALPNGSKSRFEMLLGIKEHEMHHRAQLMLMERLLGIVPHLTRARMQR
jgi:uncharacterized damage-inducible protein DinB